MQTLTIKSATREEMVAITDDLRDLVGRMGWRDGLVFLFCPHTTAGLTINENADPDVVKDVLSTLKHLVPARMGYLHAEGNSDAHVKASLMGPSLGLMVEEGRMLLGTWQGVFFCEFDGPRTRTLWVKWLGQTG